MAHSYEGRILRVLKYIHENPSADLSLDRLADVAAMSRFHWHRVFQAMTGETCAQAVRRIRMHRAASWLVHTKCSISVIAKRVGYHNVQSFTRAFSEAFGSSPGAFRNTGRLGRPQTQIMKGSIKMFKIETKRIAPLRLAAVEHRGPYTQIGPSFQKLAANANWAEDPSRFMGVVGVYYDDPNVVAEDQLRSHAAMILSPAAEMPAGLEEVELQGGEYAVLHYKGPYEAVKVAYDYLYGEWLPGSGREPADAPCYENYLNDPTTTAPENLLTDICMPLAEQKD